MAVITPGLLKELREASGAGMMDCKKALTECDGDIENAKDWLRKNGLAAAAKKAGRVAAEGLVGVAIDGNRGALVEVNSETDFVARNETFQAFVSSCATSALGAGGDLDTLKATTDSASDKPISDALTDLIAKIGENMTIRRTATVSVGQGVIANYVHNKIGDGLGKIGVIVGLQSSGDQAGLADLGKKLAMHIANTDPGYISRDEVDASALDKEREILADQARASGKPESIIEKMVEGRLRKFYEEICLLEQLYVIDGESKVSDIIAGAGKELGAEISVTGFARFKLGEGIEKEEESRSL